MRLGQKLQALPAETWQSSIMHAREHIMRKKTPIEDVIEFMRGVKPMSSIPQWEQMMIFEKDMKHSMSPQYSKKVDDAYKKHKADMKEARIPGVFPRQLLWRAIWRRHDPKKSLDLALRVLKSPAWKQDIDNANRSVMWSTPLLATVENMEEREA